MEFQQIMVWVYIAVGLTIVIGFGVYWFYLRTFNKPVNIFVKGQSGTQKKIQDKARFFVDDNNLGWWHLQRMKDKIAIPPKEAIYFSESGQECCDFIKEGDLDYRPITLLHDVQEKKAGYGALPQQSKMNYAYQWRKSLELKSNTLGALIAQFAPYMILIIVAIVGLVTYDGIAKKVIEVASIQAGVTKDMKEMQVAMVQAQLIVNANWRNQTMNPIQVPLQG